MTQTQTQPPIQRKEYSRSDSLRTYLRGVQLHSDPSQLKPALEISIHPAAEPVD